MSQLMSKDEVMRALIAVGVPKALAAKQAEKQSAPVINIVRVVTEPQTFPIRFTLPWSALCSDNRKYAPAMRGSSAVLILRPGYREAKSKAREIAVQAMTANDQRFPPLGIPLRFVARVYVPDNRSGHDVVNFAKCAQDAFEQAIYVNDELLHDARWIRAGVDVDHPRAEIEVSPL